MAKRHRNQAHKLARWVEVALGSLQRAASHLWRTLRPRHWPVPVEVLVIDRNRRQGLERELKAALRQLRHALGAELPEGLAVIVQHVIATDRQLAGCCQLAQRPDGGHFTLIRLALQVGGKRLSTDEVLAALAEQCIGLAMQQQPGASVLVPVDLDPAQPVGARDVVSFRPDPLAAQTNGAHPSERAA